ncbi:spermatogenesis-associated protein 7 homolog [Nilaparvata lugens]|uniref:spermatogenesis-associated protein 7 homolog n=1 Tax=Nilaparvata lugens TaxID=108931 RepID=UPI00193D2E91|nr:spermatogenesis-associated protein 7 homolog [Nilaparvata lugens]
MQLCILIDLFQDSAYTEEGDGMWSRGDSRGGSPQSPTSCWSMDVRSADGPYISFLRAITDEVLRKGIFTNKALKKLFREHIEKNIHRLDLKRMEDEVEKLQNELGIPKEDNMNETDFGLGSVNPEWFDSSKESNSSSKDNVAVTESLEQLVLTSEKETSEDQEDETSGTKKHQSSESRAKSSDHSANVSAKKSLKDNDNDSSIGCEIMSDYSGSGDGKSS